MLDRENGLVFKTASGKIEMRSAQLDEAELESVQAFEPPGPLADDEFRLVFGRIAVHTHAQTANNPLLHELSATNPLWIHPDRAAKLGIADGDEVEIGRAGFSGTVRARVTPLIHPDAVFLLHGFGRTVPLQTRAFGNGMADQRLQTGILGVYDPAGGGSAMTETAVKVRRLAAGGPA
jgi:thiosulfate reductase/polysulfide reductase chain A